MPTRIAVPNAPEALAETLLDKRKMSTLMEQGDFPKFMENYHRAFMKADAGQINEQANAQASAVLAQFLNAHGAASAGITPAQARANLATLNSPDAPGARLNGQFRNMADFIGTMWHRKPVLDDRTRDLRKAVDNAMSSTTGSDGGFLIPEEFRSQLLSVALETSVVRPRATVIPMTSLRVSVPTIDVTTNAGSVMGGVIGYWTEEGAALTNSQPTFGRVTLEAKKLTGYTEAPNELVSDAALAFNAFIIKVFPEAIAFYEDYAFLQGTGVGEPFGMLSADNPAIVAVTAESGQVADTVLWENIVKAYSRMLPTSLGRAVWIAHINTFPELATMALSVGTGGGPIWLNNGQVGPPMSILGRPVIFTEKAATLGDQGDISFVDPSYYLIGDRQEIRVQSSDSYKFGNDVTAFKVVDRVDGRPWLQSAITPKVGSTTLSPFVQLAAR